MRVVFRDVKLTSLKALSISGMIENVICLTALNLSDVFEPLQVQDLEYLDLTRNYIHVIYGSITAVWPKLRIIDLSYNMLGRAATGVSLLLDIMGLHQKLEIIYFEGQNEDMIRTHSENTNIKNYIINDNMSIQKRYRRDVLTQILPTVCMEKYNTTINKLISGEKSRFCDVIYCSIKNSRLANLAYFLCKVFPSFKSFMSNLDYSGNCYHYVRLPLTPTLREIHMGQFGGGRTIFDNRYVNVCFQQNKLKTVYIPSISTQALLIDSVAMKYWSFSNLKVENLDLSDNKLHVPLINPFLTSF